MKTRNVRHLLAVSMIAITPALLAAQGTGPGTPTKTDSGQIVALVPTVVATPEATATPVAPVKSKAQLAADKMSSFLPPAEIQHLRPQNKLGLNVFESPKEEGVAYTGFKLNWGAAFTQQFQGLDHSNTASPRLVNNVNANSLIKIGHGFNNAGANVYMNAQLARGIRVALTSYLSSRHHNETWVKDGYLLIDASPLDIAALNTLMKYVTLRAGHFELNYGDAHFRRTDNGNSIFNPLVGNYIMDAFTTEIGAEAYLRANGFMAMLGVTGGEVRGQVTRPAERAPSYLAKLGFDRQVSKDARVRLTGSMYSTTKSVNNTLFSGDRAGSRYYSVGENTTSTEAAQAWSGAIQPGFRSNVRAYVFNPFVKLRRLELFGNIEQAKGRAATETTTREWNQYVGEAVYRLLSNEQVYVAARYNTVRGELVGMTNKVGAKRSQIGGGWFITPTVLMKAEYVNQKYNDFPSTDIRNGGNFKGFMVEGAVAF